MRSLSLDFRRALFAQESGVVPIFLLTITHPELVNPIRLSSDDTSRLSTDPLVYGTVSRGDQYKYVAPKIQLPDERDRSPPQAKLVIANANRDLIPLARSVSSPATVKTEVVLSTDLDLVEFSIPALEIASADFDVIELTFDLTVDAQAGEDYPAGSFDPASFPGLF